MYVGYIIVASFGKYSLPNWENCFILNRLEYRFLQQFFKNSLKIFLNYIHLVCTCAFEWGDTYHEMPMEIRDQLKTVGFLFLHCRTRVCSVSGP